MTLTEFLLARIADREMLARDMQHQAAVGRPLLELRSGGTLIRELVDPARVLARCEADRRIVAQCRYGDWTDPKNHFLGEPGEDAPGDILALLALPYADHDDYRQEWKP